MKFLKESLLILSTLCFVFTVSVANADSVCYKGVSTACPPAGQGKTPLSPASCTSQFGQFPRLNDKTEALIKEHLRASMQFLMLANHFGEWDINRKGFYEYFNKLSDYAWEDAGALLEHMVKRGGQLSNKFQIPAAEDPKEQQDKFYDMTELHALSKALDIQKNLAKSTLRLITLANHGPSVNDTEEIDEWRTHGFQRDGEFAHFLADEVSDKQVLRIKHLANHVNTLSQALDETPDAGLVLYIYDTQVLN
ncbi:unnamed protein product [Allacma fusca]|uniref:Ferritin n=1 Tax=Allacma fusca TaxID=39272 RepID=A0A8J2L6H9_9HEXA|nr:unnamed protein product [Allacma fusca]